MNKSGSKRKEPTKVGEEMDSRGIEPRTTPMLRGYYTTKPQARFVVEPGARMD